MAIVVMGVSGSGKSTIAAALAEHLGREFLDADDLHPPANVAKLSAGTPLTDADRAPWLDAVAAWIGAHPGAVIACSALRRAYRDRLRSGPGTGAPEPGRREPVFFVHLDPPLALLQDRVGHRRGHFMPAAQLPAQLATLEPLQADEAGLRLSGAPGVADAVATVVAAMADAQSGS